MLGRRRYLVFLLVFLLVVVVVLGLSCERDKELDSMSQQAASDAVPGWVIFPEKEWQSIAPEEAFAQPVSSHVTSHAAKTDLLEWDAWVSRTSDKVKGSAFFGEDHSGSRWGVAIAWGGYLLQTFGDPDYRYQTASLGKSFTMACLQLAVDEGLIESADDLIKDSWTGEGQLNGPHKYLDQAHHRRLSFLQLSKHIGGFPVTNGHTWQDCRNYSNVAPSWSNCTGDPDHDNYAHAEPGTMEPVYSSGGYWRLSQALTAVWRKDLKQVVDEKIFGALGIPPERWDWTPGRKVREDSTLYPEMPGYGLYLDPPYAIEDNVVRGGPGWVVMSAKDLARYGLLLATRGVWKGECLVSDTDLLRAHGGGNGSFVAGLGRGVMLSFGKVTAAGIDFLDVPVHLFLGREPQPSSFNDRNR